MATINIKIKTCDKCGEEIKYNGWTSTLKGHRKPKRIRVLKLLNGNPDGYSYLNYEYELCQKCTKKLEEFLNTK